MRSFGFAATYSVAPQEKDGFFMLTQRQNETLAHLQKSGLNSPEEVIAWCERESTFPREGSYRRKSRRLKKIHTRKHSLLYYRQIVDFFSVREGTGLPTSRKASAMPDVKRSDRR